MNQETFEQVPIAKENVTGGQHIRQESEEEQKERTYHAHGEDHRQEMYELEALGIFLVEVDDGGAQHLGCLFGG